jgi:hypothetical protein
MSNQNRQTYEKQNRADTPGHIAGRCQRPEGESKSQRDEYEAAHKIVALANRVRGRRWHRQALFDGGDPLFVVHLISQAPGAFSKPDPHDDQNNDTDDRNKADDLAENGEDHQCVCIHWKVSVLICV